MKTKLAVVALLASLLLSAAPASAAAPPPRDTADGCPASFPSGQFRDVGSSNVHRISVDCIVGWGITSGTEPDRYSPSNLVSRGQIAAFLARLVERTGGTLPTSAPDAFDDDNGSVHEANINRLAAAGIMGGTSNRRFAPSQPVTRDQMATFVARTYQRLVGAPLPSAPEDYFADDNGSVHEDNINRLAAVGIVSGRTPTQYAPAGTVPRDAMASFLARLLDKLVEDSFTRPPVQSNFLGRCNGEGLGSVSSTGFGCSQESIDGVVYVRTLSQFVGRFNSRQRTIDFDLARDYETFTAVLGLADNSDAVLQTLFEIEVDGEVRFTQVIGFGVSVPVSIDVTDALRLRFKVTRIEQSGGDGTAVFADPFVTG